MTDQIRLRMDSQLAQEARVVCRELGITPAAAVSMFFAQMVKLRGLPFRPGDFPALDEYGVTLAQATAAEDSALAEIGAARKAGKLKAFTGKL
ncbi:MAG: type II toxin-antitoxin system RelB/DinJ family antitoxin [Verrucomicrobiota bacterium]